MLHWLGSVVRFVSIVTVTIICGLIYGGMRLWSLFTFDKDRRAAKVARMRGTVLRWYLETLGATFIKLGQVMSSRPDLLPRETIAELRKLQDDLPAFSFRKVRKIVEADLGAPLEDLFDEFEPVPVAAASVAQVHRARLKNGTEVAVKVLRPSVRRRVRGDGRLMLGLARIMTISPAAKLSDPVGHAQHFVEGIVAQTDLTIEAANYAKLRENFKNFEGVTLPEVFPKVSGRRVLTMVFVRGQKIDELGDGDHAALALKTRSLFFKMCFDDGFVHADLHPGNMLVGDNDELIIFDAGLCKELGPEILLQVVDFAKCIAMGTARDFVRHLRRFHQYMDGVDWAAVERDSELFVSKFRSQSVAELEMGKFIDEVFAMARRHKMRPLPEMTLILVGVVTSEGVSKMLDPDANTFQEMAVYLMPIVARLGLNSEPVETHAGRADQLVANEPADA